MTRIVSLLPAATEIVCALGAGDQLVGISHECDYPPAVTRLPRVTVTSIDQSQSGHDIDAEVRALKASGKPVIGVDARRLRDLAPDLLITQDLCEVCAVADGEVHRLARSFESLPRLVSLAARDLAGIWKDIRLVGEAIGRQNEAGTLVTNLEKRIAGIAPSPAARPRVVCVEWLDPLYLAGHWVPEMIWAAGGEDVMANPGSHSVISDWSRIGERGTEVVIVAICGFGMERAFKELDRLDDNHWLHTTTCSVWVLDGNAFTSRPGPRVVEGAELICSALREVERPGLARYGQRYGFNMDARGNELTATDVRRSPI